MKAGWQIKKLGDICAIELGKTPFRANKLFWDVEKKTQNVWLSIADLLNGDGKFVSDSKEYISDKGANISKKVKSGTLLVSFKLTLGRLAFAGRDLFTNEAIASLSIRNENEIFKDYLFHFLDHFDWNLATEGDVKIKGRTLNKQKLKEILIFYPPMPEQQRIVSILDEAFEGIATATANAKKNLANARELFESYLQSVFTNKGERWVERKLGEKNLLAMIDGDRGSNYPKASDFQEAGDCLFMNTKNVRPNGFEFETTMFITNEKDSQLRKGKLIRNDIVMTTRGTIGNIGLYSHDVPFDNVRINSGMLIFRVNQNQILPAFLFELFRSHIIKSQIKKHTSGAAQPQLPINTLVNFTIPVPNNLQTQQTIVDNMGKLFAETERLEAIYQQKLTALDELKKSILNQAFSGQLN